MIKQISTQKELDSFKDGFNNYTEIHITSDPNILISINQAPKNSLIILRGSSHAVLWGSSHAELRGNSSAKIQNSSVTIDKLLEQAVAICIDKKCKIIKKDKTAKCIITPKVKYNINNFVDIYFENKIGKTKIILYKSVNPKTFCDFYTGKIKYENTVICPDFDPNINRQCGGGLHLSPTPELALSYNQGKVLKCEVEIKDIVVFPDDITKVRCKKVKVIGE